MSNLIKSVDDLEVGKMYRSIHGGNPFKYIKNDGDSLHFEVKIDFGNGCIPLNVNFPIQEVFDHGIYEVQE